MTQSLRRLIALLVLSTVASVGCSVSINKAISDPGRYRTDTVELSGAVIDSYSVLGRGVYQLEDRSGKLWVVSDNGVPRKGARISVKGTVREGYDFGSLGSRLGLPPSLGAGVVLVEESHKAK